MCQIDDITRMSGQHQSSDNTGNSSVIERDRATDHGAPKPPKRYAIMIHNDDFTPFEFVNALLIAVFKHTSESSHAISTAVHKLGRGIAGTYTFEIAETKFHQASMLITKTEYPLQLSLEPQE